MATQLPSPKRRRFSLPPHALWVRYGLTETGTETPSLQSQRPDMIDGSTPIKKDGKGCRGRGASPSPLWTGLLVRYGHQSALNGSLLFTGYGFGSRLNFSLHSGQRDRCTRRQCRLANSCANAASSHHGHIVQDMFAESIEIKASGTSGITAAQYTDRALQ